MRRNDIGIGCLTLLALAGAGDRALAQMSANKLTKPEIAAGWDLLFDGLEAFGLRGYRLAGMPEEGWVVENGSLRHVKGAGGGDLVTKETYRDFELRFQWKVDEGANSGVIYRVSEDHAATYETGPEYQILDDAAHLERAHATGAGAMYGLFTRAVKVVKGPGLWNEGRIVVFGNRVRHWLNEELVVDVMIGSEAWNQRVGTSKFAEMDAFARRSAGHIAFQDHGDEVWFRGLKVRSLDAEKSMHLMDFEKRNLRGWVSVPAGAEPSSEAGWQLEDGQLVWLGGPNQGLRTTLDYMNFALSFEVRCREGGSAGLLFRSLEPAGEPHRGIELDLTPGRAGSLRPRGGFLVTGMEGDAKPAEGAGSAGEDAWDRIELNCWQDEVVVRRNGVVVNQMRGCLEAQGPIELLWDGEAPTLREWHLYQLGLEGYKGRASRRLDPK